MILFWFICGMMILMALWFILPPLWKSGPAAESDESRAANLLVYQDQLREMKADLKSGLLTEAQHEQDKEELERRLLEDVAASGRTPTVREGAAAKHLSTRTLAYGVAIAIPVAALIFYFAVGKPNLIEANPANPPTMRNR